MSFKDELLLIPKNPLVWIDTLKATPTNLKLLIALIALQTALTWYESAFVDALVGVLVAANGNDSPTGPVSVPFWLYRITLFAIPLFVISVWKSVWADHFNFPKINWYYYADFYVGCFFTAFFALLAVLYMNFILPLAVPLNQLGIWLISWDEDVFAIAFIIALIQLRALEGTAYGLKYWFIGSGIAARLSVLLGLPAFVQRPCAWAFLAVQILLIVRVLKHLQQHSAPAANCDSQQSAR
jgi:hypothetical protein